MTIWQWAFIALSPLFAGAFYGLLLVTLRLLAMLAERAPTLIKLDFDPGCLSVERFDEGVGPGALYIRLSVRPTDGVLWARGTLNRVMRFDGTRWQPTHYASAFDLPWTNHHPAELVRLDPVVNTYLDIARVFEASGEIEPFCPVPNAAADTFKGAGTFRFDVAVIGQTAHGFARGVAYLKVTTGGKERWNAPEVELINASAS